MACKVNCKCIFVGGLVAGVGINLIEWLAHGVVLMERYQGLTKMGFYFKEPTFPFMPANIALSFIVGILLAWLYAVGRDTLGAGALTAIKIGLVVGFIAGVPGNVAMVAWSTAGKLGPFVTCLAVIVECVIGTFLAGMVYKPKAES